ncbi:MAG TPA: PadR family transcriptional regulator [Syntrophales bacterium]|nr:PadR family transcriptional regulator [Syntrophales bacterium]HOM07993.1 PadR family transcriptional regulator [Syntrophales bacterium]HOO00619.1 PadR family transcriptional regulator [Syntrophales bacterium]HPC01873.1 PadR family transcriptional regulator [Syntrophales bacterium]HPQ05825.1 PadR family transcriptional regulator [Syntrophales bacterium]
MDFELMTLGYLLSGPKTGYRMQEIAGKMMLNYNLSLNQVYPTLRKLEEKGFVKKEVVIQTGRPNKNVYTITEAGKEHFLHRITAPPVPFDYVLPFLVRVLFFRHLTQEQIINEFEKEICSLQEQIDDLEAMEERVEEKADRDGKFAYRTALHLLVTLRDWYREELGRRKEGRT